MIMLEMIQREIRSHQVVLEEMMKEQQNYIYTACMICVDTLFNQKNIFVFGDASNAEQLVSQIIGKYKIDRDGLAAIALTTDSSTITSVANNFGYRYIFSRQVEALANKGDVLIAISASGKSENVIEALKTGKALGCRLVGLSGGDGGDMNALCDVNVIVPSNDTPRIQEMHTLIGHIIAQSIDSAGL